MKKIDVRFLKHNVIKTLYLSNRLQKVIEA